MKPKEKAEQLVDRYNNILGQHIFNGHFDISQQCALTVVDMIILQWEYLDKYYTDLGITIDLNYWQEVKQEIENL